MSCAIAALSVPFIGASVASAAVSAPADIIAFPQRDFVSATGYKNDHTYTVEVVHPDGTVSGTVSGIAPVPDPATPGLGTVEVNHPGGACWVGVTPDIRAGDIVRITDEQPAAGTTGIDTSVVRNVTAQRPVQTAADTVVIHGTAQDAAGSPLPVAELEQRLVSPGNLFLKNGKRTLRATSAAGSEGTLSYDAAGSINWTATYANLLPADVDRALNAESRGMWIDPALPSTESTIFENGAAAVAGPSAPCTAPLEKLPPPAGSELVPPTAPTGVKATASNTTVTLDWTAASDNVGVTDYGVFRDGVAVGTVQAPNGAAPAPTGFVDQNVAPGVHTYTIDAGDAVGNRSAQSDPPVSVTTTVNPAPPATNVPPPSPHSLIAFPSRDFISGTGYGAGVSYTYSVVRDGNTIATSTPIVPQDDPKTPAFDGLVEVNHPGGGCWVGTTPNIKPGDQVRITAPDGTSDATTVAGVTAERPIVTALDANTGGGTVVVHGTAQDAAGAPLPLDQIEQRMVAPNDAFDLNGRRTIRAGAGLDGTLSYDAPGSIHWTATYQLQTPDDLARTVGGKSTSGATFEGAESRVLWLGSSPLVGNELTIYENGPAVAGGPSAGIAGCASGPAETPVANALLSAAPKFATTAVGATTAAQDVTITNGGDAPLRLDRAYLAGLNPGDFAITANSADGATLAPGASAKVSVAFSPKAAGTRQAVLAFADDAANTSYQVVTLTGTTPAEPGGTATAPVQYLAAGQTIASATNKNNSTIEIGVGWTVTGTRSELQMATANAAGTLGAWAPVTVADGASSATVKMGLGNVNGTAYQFRVRSCDATTCGSWVNGPKFTLQAADENGFQASQWKGNWTVDTTLLGAFGGSVRWAAGSAVATIVPTAQYTVSGNAAWISTLGPDRGLAQVQLDKDKPVVVDLYSPTVQPARVVWAKDALAPGTHTVTVTALGKKSSLNPGACNTNTKCARVDVDASVMIK